MKKYDKNIDFFNNLEPDLKKTEQDLWKNIEKKTSKKTKTTIIRTNWFKYSVAAFIVVLIGITLFMRFYTENIFTQKGEHLSHTLPDSSVIELNAQTSIKYNPYWWRFNRELQFSGEAFFNVQKGEKFTVISNEGETTVLGTSFNIFARNTDYRVYCKTGKVKVTSTKHNIKYEITEGELAVIDNINKSGKKTTANEKDYLSWTKNKFSFTDTPLREVFDEIERQYNIKIKTSKSIDTLKFGAYFDKPQKTEQVLDIICIQYNLKFEKSKKNKYIISTK